MSEQIKERPLAYGFIEDGNLHSLIKWPFMEEVSVFQPVGKSLVDFIRFDRDFMQSVFAILLVRYMQAKEHKNDYNFIAAVLWDVAMQHRLIGTNNYLCWMNTRASPALSGNGSAIISKSNLHFARKKKTGIGKHMGSTKSKVLPSLFLFYFLFQFIKFRC